MERARRRRRRGRKDCGDIIASKRKEGEGKGVTTSLLA